jgi:hypothetical protein
MKIPKLIFMFFPLIAISQIRFEPIKEKLKQNNKYEYIYSFENNYAVFRTFNNKMGVIDTTGKVIIKPVFSYIYNKKELKNLFEVGNEMNKNFKRGYIDLKGNIKIPIIYDDLFYVEKNLIRVTKDNKYGVLDTLNKMVLPTKFEYLSFDNDLIIARLNSTNSLYDYTGKPVSNLQFINISHFKNNNAIITFQDKSNAIINNQGNIVLKSIKDINFEKILDNSLFLVKNKLNSKKGILNSNGKFLIKCKYDEIEQIKAFFIAKSNTKKGIISLTDSIIKPFVYDEIYPNYSSYIITLGSIIPERNNFGENYITIKHKLYGVLNPNIKIEIIPMRYKNIEELFGQYYIVQDDRNKKGLFFKDGTKILNEEYEFYNVFDNKIFATKNNKPLLIALKDEKYNETEVFVDEFLKFKYEREYPNNGYQIFKSKGKYGVLNYENKTAIPNEYELIENVYNSKEFIVKKNNKYGLVNTENKIILEIEYDYFEIKKEHILFTKGKQVKKYHEIKF